MSCRGEGYSYLGGYPPVLTGVPPPSRKGIGSDAGKGPETGVPPGKDLGPEAVKGPGARGCEGS